MINSLGLREDLGFVLQTSLLHEESVEFDGRSLSLLDQEMVVVPSRNALEEVCHLL